MIRFLFLFIFSNSILLSCDKSIESKGIEYNYDQIKFQFPEGESEGAGLNFYRSYSAPLTRYLDRIFINDLRVEGQSFSYVTFVKPEKFETRPLPVYCAGENSESTPQQLGFSLPFKVTYGQDFILHSKAPILARLNSARDCMVEFSKYISLGDGQKNLLNPVSGNKLEGSRGEAVDESGRKVEWVIEDGAKELHVYIRTHYENGPVEIKAAYKGDQVIEFSQFASEHSDWMNSQYKDDKVNKNENSESENTGESEDGENAGSVNFTIPEEWFQ